MNSFERIKYSLLKILRQDHAEELLTPFQGKEHTQYNRREQTELLSCVHLS